MRRFPRVLSRRFFHAVSATILGLATGVAFVLLFGPFERTYPNGDQAVLEIYTLHALHGKLLLGPYSQHLWHHPGPSYFYILAPFYWLGGKTEISLYVAALALNLTAIAAAVAILAKYHDRFTAIGMCGLAALYAVRGSEFFVNAWNPHIVVLWLVALVLLCALVIDGRIQFLPAVAATASFILQTHVAPGLVAIALMVVATTKAAAAWIAQDRAQTRPIGRWLMVAALVCVAMWALPLAEQLFGEPGNLRSLYQFFVERQHHPSLTDAGRAFARALSAPFDPTVTMAVERPLLAAGSGLSGPIAASQLLLLPLAAWLAARRGAWLTATTCVLALSASLLGFVSVTRSQGMIEDHHVFWISALGLVNVLALLSSCSAPILSTLFARLSFTLPIRYSPTILIALLAALGVYGLLLVKSQYDRALRTGAVVRAFTYGIEQYLETDAVQRPLIHAAQVAWPEAAGVVLQLYKQGVPVTLDSHWTPIMGEQLAATGHEDAEIVFADLPLAASMTKDDRYKRLARHANLFVFARRLGVNHQSSNLSSSTAFLQ